MHHPLCRLMRMTPAQLASFRVSAAMQSVSMEELPALRPALGGKAVADVR